MYAKTSAANIPCCSWRPRHRHEQPLSSHLPLLLLLLQGLEFLSSLGTKRKVFDIRGGEGF